MPYVQFPITERLKQEELKMFITILELTSLVDFIVNRKTENSRTKIE